MKTLLTVKAVLEALAGVAVILVPSQAVWLLFGTPLNAAGAVSFGRLAGVALLALGIACWFTRTDSQSRPAVGLVMVLFFYDLAVVAIFLIARFGDGVSGLALAPAIGLHSSLGIWSAVCLRNNRPRAGLL